MSKENRKKEFTLQKKSKLVPTVICSVLIVLTCILAILLREKHRLRDAERYYQQGMMALQQGKKKKALENFDKALNKNSKLANAYRERGKLLYAFGKHKQAISDFTHALIAPEAKDYCFLGFAYFEQKKLDISLKNLQKAIEMNPKCYKAYKRIFEIYKKQKNTRKPFNL